MPEKHCTWVIEATELKFEVRSDLQIEMARFQKPVPIWETVILPQNQNRIGSGPVPNEPEYQLK